MKRRERIDVLQADVKRLQALIQKEKDACSHIEGFEVMMYYWRPGSFEPKRICVMCDGIFPGITHEEYKKCWNKYDGSTL